jgi:allantoicase
VSETIDFLDLPELASEAVGGAALACNDEFFAAMENLLRDHPAAWKEHAYTDRGKWMDGWETRRRRDPGHDWCVIRLGMPGVIRGVVVDTAHFRGNYPAECSIDACEIVDPLDAAALAGASWTELLPRSALRGDERHAFAVTAGGRVTHLRLNIFPDGGVARLRVHGEVRPDWARLRALGGVIDLAALEHGGWVESCSDMFFGSRNNLIKPGRATGMVDGWETRRRRGPGHDWAIVRLACVGTIERIEIDTSHFKGNAPGRCLVEACHAPSGAEGRWRPVVATPLGPHTRHVFDDALRRVGQVTHVRLNVYPDGGIARLRVLGYPAPIASDGLAVLNGVPDEDATASLKRCCGSSRWVARMVAARPFEDVAAMQRIGEALFWQLDDADWLEAFAAHPRIGERGGGAWSDREQASTRDAEAARLTELAAANQTYVDRFGFIYIVCASGRSLDEMLVDLRARLESSTDQELRAAAEEQCKITRLRLGAMIDELGAGAAQGGS